MFAIVTLACLLGVAAASSSSSSEDGTGTDSDSSTSGLLERVAAGKKLVFDLAADSEVTSTDEDDDDTFTSTLSSSSLEAQRRAEREAKKDKRIQAALDKANERRLARQAGLRESYQAVMRCAECETDNVALGPVVFIAKSTASKVQDDHFDQNPNGPNGVDDVADALDNWAQTFNAGQRDSALEDFLLQVRNRATINGGTIGLQSLILTGKVKQNQNRFAQDSTTDATFGGSAGRVLISPCMPVVRPAFGATSNFNIQVFGEISGFPSIFTINDASESVGLSAFVDSNNDFVDQSSTITEAFKIFDDANVLSDDDDNNAADDDDPDATTVLPNTFGTLQFERCTAFSYFA